MRMMRTSNNSAARPAFTMIELMVVIVIIAIAISIGATAYLRMVPEAEKRTAAETLRAVAAAVQMYYQEQRDYPPMRYSDLIPYNAATLPKWPDHTGDAVPNGPESIEACLYMLEYRSSAGKSLQSLPSKVYKQLQPTPTTSDTVIDGLAGSRPLHVILDPWGNPVQYVRPREAKPYSADYPLSAGRLNNRVLLVSMGPDGAPGKAGVNDPTGATGPGADFWQDYRGDPTNGDNTKEYFPDPVQLGQGDDIVVEVGATR